MNIGVLGSSGYLGKNLALALESNHKIIRMSLREDCQLNQVYVGKWGKEDINRSRLEGLVVCTSPDARTCNEDPIETLKLVLVKLERFLRIAAESGVKTIVYLSTCRVYKDNCIRITEESEVSHQDMYSVSHLAGESVLRDICLSQGISGACFRLSNVFGTHIESHKDSPMWRLAANSFICDIANRRSIEVLSPEAMRDFIPLSVVIKAVRNYIEQKKVEKHFDIINVASGYTLSMQEARDILVRIGSGKVGVNSIGLELEKLQSVAGVRRKIEKTKAEQMGLYISKDIYESYIKDTGLTLRIAQGCTP